MQITAAENVPSILADGLKAAVVPECIKRIINGNVRRAGQ
jgi:hypothetical protein